MKNIEEKIFTFINQQQLITKNDKVLIALSGGPDSVFCLSFFYKYRKKYKIELAAVHVNHNLRGNQSKLDEKFCKKLCKKLDIELFVFSENVAEFAKNKKCSIEEAGRIIRYNRFDELVKKYNFNKMITAHTLDDNSESILLNMIKGTGLTGLEGISIKRDYIIRPLLCVSKAEILKYLSSYKIEFRNDKSNLSEEYQRNFLRLKVIPLLKEINPNLNEAFWKLSLLSKNIFNLANENVEKFFDEHKLYFERFEIPLELFDLKNELIQSELIKRFFNEILKVGFVFNDLVKVKKLVCSQKGKRILFKNSWFAVRESDRIVFSQNINPNNDSKLFDLKIGKIHFDDLIIKIEKVEKEAFNFTSNNSEIFIDAEKINGKLCLRRWQDGDRFIPIGMKGNKKVSDFLTDIKVNSISKKNVKVLTDRNNIIWIVGLRLSEKYKITSKTKKVFKISVIENEK